MIKRALIASALLATAVGTAFAQEGKDPAQYLISDGQSTFLTASEVEDLRGAGLPPTDFFITLETPEGHVQSMDGIGNEVNCMIDVNVGAGNEIAGISWDLRIETLGGSWLSEARQRFTNTIDTTTGLFLTPGVGDGAPGASDYSSNGVLVLADVDIPNIVIGPDGIFQIEFYESFVDNAGAPDADLFNAPAGAPFGFTFLCTDQAACDAAILNPANFSTSGQCDGFDFSQEGEGPIVLPESTPVPTNSAWALGLLVLLMAGFGLFVVRRLS